MNTTPTIRRAANGHYLPGTVANPGGRPAKIKEVEDLAREHTAQAFAKLVELLSHRDGRVALNAAIAILDRGWGRPAQSVKADVTKVDLTKLYVEAMQLISLPTTIEAVPVVEKAAPEQTQIRNGFPTTFAETRDTRPQEPRWRG